MRQIASQFDSVKRENQALTSNIDIFRKSEEQLRIENSNLKELINNIESERIHYRAISEQLQREIAYSKKESAISNYATSDAGLNYMNRPPMGDLAFQPPTNENFNLMKLKQEWQDYQKQYMSSASELPFSPPKIDQPPMNDIPQMANYQDIYQAPTQDLPPSPGMNGSSSSPNLMPNNSQFSEDKKRDDHKLPQHLASSISFDYPDQFDQYYRKNRSDNTRGGQNNTADVAGASNINPHIREDAQKAYFQSHLGNVFDWNQNNMQGPQGAQLPSQPQMPPPQQPSQELSITQNIPPASQLNTLQKNELVMKLGKFLVNCFLSLLNIHHLQKHKNLTSHLTQTHPIIF